LNIQIHNFTDSVNRIMTRTVRYKLIPDPIRDYFTRIVYCLSWSRAAGSHNWTTRVMCV